MSFIFYTICYNKEKNYYTLSMKATTTEEEQKPTRAHKRKNHRICFVLRTLMSTRYRRIRFHRPTDIMQYAPFNDINNRKNDCTHTFY